MTEKEKLDIVFKGSGIRAIDPWVNLDSRWDTPPEWLTRVQTDYINTPEVNKRSTKEELLQIMDESGVHKSILTIYPHKVPDYTLDCVFSHPDRFALCVDVDPSNLMDELFKLEKLKQSYPVVMARVVPFALRNPIPPTHPHYYPLYAKCIELDLPLSINTGICGR